MTTFGPDHFFSCPNCKVTLRRKTLRSGNTFGSTLWSDGYLDAPMRPQVVEVTRCPVCQGPFFVEDAEDVGDEWSYGAVWRGLSEVLPEDFQKAPKVAEADHVALSELAQKTADRERLRYLLMQSWQIYNHPVRKRKVKGKKPNPEGLKGALERLIGLLDDDRGQDQIMKAEALRELGKHAEAIAALQDIDAELGWVADQIRTMAQAGVSAVAMLLRPGEVRREAESGVADDFVSAG
jgi:hypothetical protein